MAVSITASLAGATVPQSVQLVVTGLTAGVPFAVTGQTASGWSWVVPGGNGGPASGTTVILADLLTPVNAALTYTVEQASDVDTSPPITVDFDGGYVLQSVDGAVVVPFTGVGNGSARTTGVRVATFDVPGRTSPLTVWDVSPGESGAFEMLTTRAGSDALRLRLRTGSPVFALRSDGALYDFDPVTLLVVTSLSSSSPSWYVHDRVWSIAYRVIDHPEPSLIQAASTWDDFDAVYSALTGADFDAEWSTLTGDDFDVVDWSVR